MKIMLPSQEHNVLTFYFVHIIHLTSNTKHSPKKTLCFLLKTAVLHYVMQRSAETCRVRRQQCNANILPIVLELLSDRATDPPPAPLFFPSDIIDQESPVEGTDGPS